MANQTRNEIDGRTPNGTATQAGPTAARDGTESPRGATQAGETARDEFYRTAPRGSWRDESAPSAGGGTHARPPAASHAGRDRGQDVRGTRGEEYGPRTWADSHAGQQHPFDRARMGVTNDMEDVGAGSPLGYGDYGHPSDGGRRAYGDMGFPRGGGLAGRLKRKWRGAAQNARDVMTRNPRTVRATETVQNVSQMMIDEDTGIVPVCDEAGRLLGVVTDRDIVCRLVARGVDLRSAKASDAMTSEVECVTEQESLHDVLRLMAHHQIRRVPVVARGDRLVGIISIGDIAREADVDEELQDTFEEISSSRTFWSRLR